MADADGVDPPITIDEALLEFVGRGLAAQRALDLITARTERGSTLTRDKILAGLHELVLRLGNNQDTTPPPDDWAPEEWAYVKGLASARIWLLIADLRQ